MEIIDYLRVARRRLLILVLVPLLAVGIAIASVLLTGTKYTATATLSTAALVGAPSSQFTGTRGPDQFVAAFTAAATGPAVLAAAASDTGLTSGELSDGLVVAQNGASSDISLTFTTENESDVAPALEAIESEALNSLFGFQVTLAQQQVQEAQGAVDDANTALSLLSEKSGTADPELAYEAQLTRLNALLQRQSNLEASGDRLGAASMEPRIADVRKEVARYQPILSRYKNLLVAQQAAVSDLTLARADFSGAQKQVAAADVSEITFMSDVHAVGRSGALFGTLVPVFGAAVFLAILLVLILELMANSSARRSAQQSTTTGKVTDESSSPYARQHETWVK